MQEQMKRESEVREAENAVLSQTILDQRLTKTILNKALLRMKQVYDFLQSQAAPHIQTSGTHTDPGNGPARFGDYEQNRGGSRVVRMLEEIIADSRKAEDDAIAHSEDSQTAYENFMKDTNEGITAYTKKTVNMKKALSKAHEELSLTKEDLVATLNKLEDLYDEKGSLKTACDYVLKNFDARQEARTAEMNALAEAKAILSGAK